MGDTQVYSWEIEHDVIMHVAQRKHLFNIWRLLLPVNRGHYDSLSYG